MVTKATAFLLAAGVLVSGCMSEEQWTAYYTGICKQFGPEYMALDSNEPLTKDQIDYCVEMEKSGIGMDVDIWGSDDGTDSNTSPN